MGVFMEIRPEVLERLLKEDDARLWETVRRVAVMNNITLPLVPPGKEDMEKLRAIMRSGSLKYEDALSLISHYKEEKKP